MNASFKTIEKHGPSKKKILRGNYVPHYTKELRNAIYTRSRLINKFLRNLNKANESYINSSKTNASLLSLLKTCSPILQAMATDKHKTFQNVKVFPDK